MAAFDHVTIVCYKAEQCAISYNVTMTINPCHFREGKTEIRKLQSSVEEHTACEWEGCKSLFSSPKPGYFGGGILELR